MRRAIIDKGVRVPPGIQIGFDPELDRRRGFTLSPNGVVVIAKRENIPTTDLSLGQEQEMRMDPPMVLSSPRFATPAKRGITLRDDEN